MYPLCDQTVTVYRLSEGRIHRQVLVGCYLQTAESRLPQDDRPQRTFLLVVPGPEAQILVGDRVVPGEGPQITLEGWQHFLPVSVPDLVVVGKTQRFYWEGQLSHTEATN